MIDSEVNAVATLRSWLAEVQNTAAAMITMGVSWSDKFAVESYVSAEAIARRWILRRTNRTDYVDPYKKHAKGFRGFKFHNA